MELSNSVKKIFEMMDSLGLSAYAVSQATGISKGNFTAWKNGKYAPSYETFVKLADYFEVPVSYFLDDSDHPKGSMYLPYLTTTGEPLTPEQMRQVQDYISFITRNSK